MKLTFLSESIFTISSVLSEDECEQYIEFAENKGFSEAKVNTSAGQQMHKNIRNNDRVMMIDHDIAQSLWGRVEDIFPDILPDLKPIGLNEMIKFYRYDGAQRFKMHKDGRYRASESVESRMSFLVYLNNDYEGGETKFRELSMKFKPRTGSVLCFIHELWHEGTQLKNGRKYVLRSDVMFAERGKT